MLNPDKKQNIFINGMMGAGKTTFGSLVAKKLACAFVDTDIVIEKNTNMTISKIFATKGEAYFRDLEHELMKEIIEKQDQVVATGGGMLVDKRNMQLATDNGFVIYLHTSLDVIYQRVREDNRRPLLQGGELFSKLMEIFEQRRSTYYSIPCSIPSEMGDQGDDVVNYIIKEYQKWLQS